jgi:hypothetical protein
VFADRTAKVGALARAKRHPKHHPLGFAYRRPLARPSRTLPALPETCHRRFQQWIREGTLSRILEALAEDLKERGNLDLSECFIDGTFVVAKKGGSVLERPSGAKV